MTAQKIRKILTSNGYDIVLVPFGGFSPLRAGCANRIIVELLKHGLHTWKGILQFTGNDLTASENELGYAEREFGGGQIGLDQRRGRLSVMTGFPLAQSRLDAGHIEKQP